MNRVLPILIIVLMTFSIVNGQIRFNNLYDEGTDRAERGENVVFYNDRYYTGSEMLYDPGLDPFLHNRLVFNIIDENGLLIETKRYGYWPYTFRSQAFIKADGGFVFAGTRDSEIEPDNYFLMKLDEQGDSLWTVLYGTNEEDVVQSVIQTDDEGYLLIGSSDGFGNPSGNIYVVKTDARGNLKWEQAYGQCCDQYRAYGVAQTDDGGFLIAANHRENSLDKFQIYMLKIDENGGFEWDKHYEEYVGSGTLQILTLADGNYLIIGQYIKTFNTNPLLTDWDGYLIKIEPNGEIIWEQFYGQSNSSSSGLLDYFINGKELSDNSIVLIGSREREDVAWLTKLDSEGEMLWERFYERSEFSDFFYGIDTTADGGFIIVGNAREVAGVDTDVWLVKTDEFGCDTMGCEIYDSVVELAPIPNLQVYPNPVVNKVTVQFPSVALNARIEVIDLLGKVYMNIQYDMVQSKCQLNMQHLPAGVYFLRVTVDDKKQEVRMVVKN